MSSPAHENQTSFWGAVVGLWFLLMLATGGVTNASSLVVSLQLIVSVALLLLGLLRIRREHLSWFAISAWVILMLGMLHMAAQLIPLPSSIWSTLPGRDLIKNTLALTGAGLPEMPLSLMPAKTSAALLALVPALAGFVAALSFRSRDMFWLAIAIVFGAIVSSCFGLFQKTGQVPDWLYFYSEPGSRLASGFFRNRNYLAALIFASLPFLAVVATSLQRYYRIHTIIVIGFILSYMAIMLAGLAAIGSRGGTLLAMPAVLLTMVFVYKVPLEITRAGRSSIAAVSVLGAMFLIAQVSMIGILRLAETDPLEDYRVTILNTTWMATKAYWPIGSGFGSFVNVYQIYETPNAILNTYINAAHNDWLQIILEGGALTALLCVAFILLFTTGVIRTFKSNLIADEYSSGIRAGIVTVMLLSLHAFVDFGLRTPALMSLFSIACGLVCLSGRYDTGRMKVRTKRNNVTKVETATVDVLPQDQQPRKQYFKTASSEPSK